ncbi:lysylphosphatidylglycerol synthase domain-containing protein [Asaia spathodeae]|uniref:Lysylphosphatidylglycerol synthetase family protein n=1 Tax=Asaia spathodeae TaxID=657016 RepID=A0ABX2P2G0_9PROT|nr:lysylphosphatidylglycerol synthase domain-containing protein [Asaia spathodeae]GBR13586.1 transporter [Asaia spathodeae NBRC 105894]
MTVQEQTTSCCEEGEAKQTSPWRRLACRLPALVGLVLLVAAIFVIQKELKSLSLSEIRSAFAAIPTQALAAGVGCTVLSYFILSFYDWLACYHIGSKQSFLRTAFAAFCSYVLSHNLGCSAISGAAVRFRLYRNWDVSPGGIAQIIAFCSTTYLLGAMALIGGVLLFEPSHIPLIDHLPHLLLQCGGAAAWMAVLAYLVVSVRYRQMRIWRYTLDVPGFRVALAQVVVSSADMAATALIAFVLLPPQATISFPAFLAIYIASYTAGLVASVPGGLGVFDGAMLLALGPYMPTPQILGVVLTFRLFYYIIPLVLAGIMFAVHELFLRGDAAWAKRRGAIPGVALMRRPSQVVRESEADFSVTVATGVVAGTGILLVFYAVAVPAPLLGTPFAHLLLQAAEFLLCLTGVMLVGVAAGLAQRVTAAWRASLTLLGLAIPLVILRQGPLGISLSLALVMFLIAPFRACYYRKARLFSEPLSPTLMAPVTLWVVSLASVGLFALRQHLGHAWWRSLIYDAHTSVVRWALGISAILGIVAVVQMLRRSQVLVRPWDRESETLYKSLAHALEELGPRRPSGLILNDNGRAGIPFLRTGQFIIGVGDPAGAENDCIAAIWRLRDLAMEEGRHPVFIKVGQALIGVYHDIGMTVCPNGPGESGVLCCLAQDLQAVKAVLGSEHKRLKRLLNAKGFLSVKARTDRAG